MNKEVSTTVKIRFSDCDPIGHLNNVKYLEYMLNFTILLTKNILRKQVALGLPFKTKLLILKK